MKTCVRRMSVRGKKEFEVKIDRNEQISDTEMVMGTAQDVLKRYCL